MVLKGSVTSQNPPHIFDPNTSLQEFKRDWTNAKHHTENDPDIVVSRSLRLKTYNLYAIAAATVTIAIPLQVERRQLFRNV